MWKGRTRLRERYRYRERMNYSTVAQLQPEVVVCALGPMSGVRHVVIGEADGKTR